MQIWTRYVFFKMQILSSPEPIFVLDTGSSQCKFELDIDLY